MRETKVMLMVAAVVGFIAYRVLDKRARDKRIAAAAWGGEGSRQLSYSNSPDQVLSGVAQWSV